MSTPTGTCACGCKVAMAAALAVAVLGTLAASAADRSAVLCEEFTRTNCGYCPYAAVAIDWLTDEYPDSFIPVEYHTASYLPEYVPYCTTRANFYGVTGTPTAWFDGKTELVGAYTDNTQQYNWYKGAYLSRMGIRTPLTIELTVVRTSDTELEATAVVTMEPDTVGKYLRTHIARVLDYWPTPGYNERNTFRDMAAVDEYPLDPNETRTTIRTFDYSGDAASVANPDNIKIIAWVQNLGNPPSADVYNAAQAVGPFEGETWDLGDMNCDGLINNGDIDPFVLSITQPGQYPVDYPDCDIMNGDMNDDGFVNNGDIDPFVTLLGS